MSAPAVSSVSPSRLLVGFTVSNSSTPRTFKFFALEDRVLLSGEGMEGLDSIDVESADLAQALLSQLDDAQGRSVDPTTESSQSPQPSNSDNFLGDAPIAAQDSSHEQDTVRLEVVFVNEGAGDFDTLLHQLRDGSDANTDWMIVELSADEDGVSQISETLSKLTGVDNVHLLASGDGSSLQLGSTELNIDTAPGYSGEIARWAHSFDENAGITLHGGNLQSSPDGLLLLHSLAALCDCEVASDIQPHEAIHNDTIATIGIAETTSDSLVDDVRRELAFVDSNVHNYQEIIAQLGHDVEVILLDSTQDGLEQITSALADRSGLDAVHIFSHGVDGGIQVGATWINEFSLQWQSDIIASWSTALSINADLLLYGCNIASTDAGKSFVNELAMITGADVMASVDDTGHESLGGDWELEYSTGSIETDPAVDAESMDDWDEVLAISANGTATSGQTASGNSLNWSHTVASGANRVMYVTLAIDGLGAGVNSVTYGGVNLTQVGRTAGNHAVEIWRLVNPSVGTASVFVTLDSTTAIKGGAVTYNGVDQGTPNGTYASATGTGTTATLNVSSAAGRLVLDITNWDNNPTGYTIGAGQTSQWSLTNGAHRGVTTTEAGASTVTMSSTVSASNQWEMGAISINNAPNNAPQAFADSVSGNEDTSITGNVLTNDTDANADTLNAILVRGPSQGGLTLGSNGAFTYTPNPNYNGTDSFQYLANDGNTGLQHYYGLEGNGNDAFGTANGTTMNGPTTVAGKNGQALQFDGVDDYVLLPDIVYNNEFSISFNFRVADNSGTGLQYLFHQGALSSGNFSGETIAVAIVESSHPTTTQRNQLVTTVWDSNDPLSNQIFIDIPTLIGDSQWHTYTMTVQAGVGTQVYIDGVLSGTLARGGDAINPTGNAYIGGRADLAANRFVNAGTAIDSFAVYNRTLTSSEAANLHAYSSQGTANLTVNAANDAPTNAGTLPAILTVSEDLLSNLDLSSIILSDIDHGGGNLTLVLGTDAGGNLTAAAMAGISIGTNGTDYITLTGTLADLNAYLDVTTNIRYLHPTANINGVAADILYVSIDDNGNTGSGGALSAILGDIQINIAGVNDEQVLSVNTGLTVSENSSNSIITSAMLSTTDVDHSASQLTYTITAATSSGTLRRSGSILNVASNFTQADINSGIITYDHNGTEVFADSFSFTVDDGVGSNIAATFNLVIAPVNDNAVTIVSNGGGPNANVDVNETFVHVTQVTPNDADLPGDSIVFSIIGGTDQSAFTIDSSGNLSFVAPPDFENPSDANLDNIYTVTVQVSDGVHTASQSISVSVIDVQSSVLAVTTTADADDTGLGASYTIEQLYAVGGGADGKISLREAIIAANNTLGADTITFALLNTEAGYTGTAGVDAYWQISLTAALPTITEAVLLDGLSQTSFGGDVNPGALGTSSTVGSGSQNLWDVEKPEIVIVGAAGFAGITVAADDVTIQGFSMYGFSTSTAILLSDGYSNAVLQYNVFGTGPTTIADPGAALNNLQNVQSLGADNGMLSNNILAYSQATGFYGTAGTNGWSISNNHFINSGYNYSNGDAIALNATNGAFIDGNLITGTSTQAIILSGSTSNVFITNNTITGNAVGPIIGSHSQYDAIALRSGTNNITISENIIANNFGAGVTVNNGAYAVEITQNSFYGNGTVLSRQGAAASGIVAIDLQTTGENANFGTAPYYTANDLGDADTGGNSLQNFPVATSANFDGNQLLLGGTFNSLASRTYRIEVYTTQSYLNGHGQGEVYLGSFNVTTDVNGDATFDETLITTLPPGALVTTTATDLTTNETSEFSQQFAVNFAATISNVEASVLNYDENHGPTAITSTLTLNDADDTNLESATVQITSNYVDGEDSLTFTNTANITGFWNSATGALTLSGTASVAQYEAALRSVVYENSSNSPTIATRTVSFMVNDGGVDSTSISRDIVVNAINDAPVLDDTGTMTMSSINENETTNSGQIVSAIIASGLGDRITDADAGALEGIAITSLASGNGVWQYSLDGSSWLDVGIVSESAALLLRATDHLRFVPNGLNGTSASFDFRAWDQSGGIVATKVDTTTNGGVTAFSTATETASIAVDEVNDEPTGTDVVITLVEDTTYVFTVADFGFVDTDGNLLDRVWLMSLPAEGQLFNNGIAVGVNDDVSAADIASGLFTFTPAVNGQGIGYASFEFQVQDDGDTNHGGQNRDTSNHVVTLDVTNVNDSPTITNASLASINEDTTNSGSTISSLFGIGFNDVDPGASLQGIAITSNTTPVGEGTWQYSTNGGASWHDVGTVGSSNALALSASSQLRFFPALNFNGTPTPLNLRAIDNTYAGGFTASATRMTIDAGTAGGSSPIGSNVATLSVDVLPVNDAAVILDLQGDSVEYVEGDGAVIIDNTVAATVTDVDSTDFDTGNLTITILSGGEVLEDVLAVRNQGTGVSEIGVSGSNVTYEGVIIGTWTGGSNGVNLVVTLNANATHQATSALLNNITYENIDLVNPTSTTRHIAFTLNDGDGATSASRSVNVNVGNVNTPSTVDLNTGGPLTYIENDAPTLFATSATVVDGDSIDFFGGYVRVSATTGGAFQDNFSLLNQGTGPGQVSRSGNNVLYEGVIVGTISGGSNGSQLSIDLNANSNAEAAQAIVRHLMYENSSDDPNATRTATVSVSDGDGGVTTDTIVIDVTPVNDAGEINVGFEFTQATFGGSTSRNDLGKVNYNADTFIPIDTSLTYDLSVTAHAGDGAGGDLDPAEYHYLGFTSYDSDLLAITSFHVSKYAGSTDTTLAFDLLPGATQIILNDATGWNNIAGGTPASLAWYGYTNSSGYTYEDYTYTRNVATSLWSAGAVSGNVITLDSAWAGPAIYAGTAVRNATSLTGTYQYALLSAQSIPQIPTNYTATIGGSVSTNGTDNATLFRAGTAYIKPLVLANFTDTETQLTVSNFTVTASTALTEFVENGSPVNIIDNDFVITDVDDSYAESVTITLTNGKIADTFHVNIAAINALGISVSGVPASSLVNDGAITITLTSDVANSVSFADYKDALGHLTFENTSESPDTTNRNVTFVMNDGDADSLETTLLIKVRGVNDAPVLDNTGFMQLTTISEDDVANAGNTVSQIIASGGGDRVTDVDGSAVEGIAISSVSGTNGIWQFNIGSGWIDVGSVSSTSALLLRASDSLRFLPNGGNGDTGTILFQAWDQTSGMAGTKVDSSVSGGATAFSEQIEAAVIIVTPVNDAPVLDNTGDATFTQITEDQVNHAGNLVSAVINSAGGNRITDVDTGAVEGIAITTLNSGNGTWQFSLDGSNWSDIGIVSDASALLLRSTDHLRFVPNGQNATLADITFRAWDQTLGSAGNKVDASVHGNATAFSTNTEVASITVSAVNDAPTVSDGAMVTLAGTDEDNISPSTTVGSIVTSAAWADVDSGAVQGIAVTSTTGNGIWQYFAGGVWTDFGVTTHTASLLLNDSTLIRYRPDQLNGEVAEFTFRGWDQTSGTASASESPQYANSTTHGGSTAFSTQTASAQLIVAAVNDAAVVVADVNTAYEAGGYANASPGSNPIGNVIANDSDVDTGDTLIVTGVEASTVASASGNVNSVVLGSYGSIQIDLGGNYVYTVDNLNVNVQALRTNSETLTDTFTYTVQDSGGASSSTQIVITIRGANDAPIAIVDYAIAIEAGGNADNIPGTNPSDNVFSNDSDVDSGDTQTIIGVQSGVQGSASGNVNSAVGGLFGSLTLNAAGVYIYTVDNSNSTVQALRTSTDTLVDVFTYTMQDTVGLTSTAQITVTIQGANDAPYDLAAAGLTIAENAANGALVAAMTSSDRDNGDTMAYTLIDNAGGRFSINAATGEITVANGTLLNRESDASHGVVVRVTDLGGASYDESFTVTVTDVDEFDVEFVTDTDLSPNSVDENATAGVSVAITANASDDDATNSAITYSLQDNDGGNFVIDGASGVVSTAVSFDSETHGATRIIVIRATSQDGSFTDQQFTIAINDVNEFSIGPLTDTNVTADSVAENAANGTTVGLTALAVDSDASTNNILYTLDNNAAGRFAINSATGEITVADGTLLDYEAATAHTITVRATSADSSFSTADFTINLTDVNEAPVGVIVETDASANYVLENSPGGTTVGITVFASDADGTDTVSYSLDDNATGRFTINANTGVVTVLGTIDREDAASYDIIVRATSSDSSFSTETYTIIIGDIDEFAISAITDSDGASDSVLENATIGMTVGVTAFAVDADATNSSVTYMLTDNDGGRFAIDSTTGIVTVAATIDRETDGPTRSITVRATSEDATFSLQSFVINILDADELDVTIPTDIDASANEVDENVAIGTTVGVQASAADLDATNNTITYTLSSNPDNLFQIDAVTGAVTTAAAIDREAHGATRSITVQATSSDGSTAFETFNITINDLDEFDVTIPIDVNASANAVNENGAVGTTVGVQASAADLDATNNTITYSLTDNPDNLFQIDATTGIVTTAAAIDREAHGATRSITVQATSSDGSTSSQTFNIAINDLDEFDVTIPTDVDASTNQVDENVTVGTSVGVQASAADLDATNNTITYSLTSNPDNLFQIDATTGIVTTAAAIDREAHGATRSITVQATSSDGSVTTETFIIAINDLDEFDLTTPTDVDAATNEVDENVTIGTTVGVQASAADLDATNNTITYTLSSNPDNLFQIDAVTGAVTTAATIDREAHGPTRLITVQASSSDGSTATETIIIAINDLDEFDVTIPTDVDASTNQVDENVAIGTSVGVQASAADLDATNNTVTYTLSSNPDGLFQIDATTGIVTTAAAITRETHGMNRTITVQAVSSDGSTAVETFNIAINDLNEFDVTVPTDTDAASDWVLENSSDGTIVGVVVSAVDHDATNNVVTYALVNDAGGRFTIGSTTGIVTVADGSLLDRETAATHGITIQATSTDGSTSQLVVTIQLGDVNDNAPVILPNQTLAIAENSVIGSSVGFVVATDADLGTTFTNWQIIGGNVDGTFAIDTVTGEIRLAIVGPDFETLSSYTLEIMTSDGTFDSLSQLVTVQVVDDNEAPVAGNDNYSTLVQTDIRLEAPPILANDSDVDGDAMFIVVVTGPVNGTLSVDGDGVIRYRPNPGFFGTETITYRASDGSLQSNDATITISVQAVGDGGGSSGSDGGNSGGSGGDSGDTGSDGGTSGSGTIGSGSSAATDATLLGGTNPTNPFASNQSNSHAEANDGASARGDRGAVGHRLNMPSSGDATSTPTYGRVGFGIASVESQRTNVTIQTLERILEMDLAQGIVWTQWDNDLQNGNENGFDWDVSVGAVGVTAGLVSIGYVLWAIRGGLFLATVYSGLPTWRMIDPTTLLTAYRGSQSAGPDKIDDMLG